MNRLTALLLSGFIAGTVATAAQLLLWWLSGAPVLSLLLRDTCLTAAIVLGTGVLSPPLSLNAVILLSATMIHLAISFVWAVPATLCSVRLEKAAKRFFAGIVYGVIVYLVDLYGFTRLFPWFAVSRGTGTLIAHGVFGLTLFFMGARLQARAK